MKISRRERELYDSIARGWNTWDVASVAAHVLLPQRIRVNVAVIIPERNAYSENALWEQVEEFGEHSDDGRYTCVTLKYMERLWKLETSARGEELLIRVTPLSESRRSFIALEVSNIWGGRNLTAYENDTVVVTEHGGKRHVIKTLNRISEPEWNPSCKLTICAEAGETVYFTVNSQKTKRELDQALEQAYQEWMSATIRSDGDMEQALAGMRRSLLWNLVYESRNRRPITPVSRNWCTNRGRHFGDYVLFGWDTFFAAIQYGLFSKKLAFATFLSMLDEITPEGMIPNFGSATGQSRDRSEPQVGALCAWKLYVQFGEKWFLEECFERLLEWNRWRFRERDFNGDGLLELASTTYEAEYDEIVANGAPSYEGIDGPVSTEHTSHGRRGAKWESGLDNSTMWDRAVYNETCHCLELSYVGLNALMAADSRLLARIGHEIGASQEVIDELEERAERLSDRINEELWCGERGIYLNRHWSGEFDPTLSLTHFYVWMTGKVDEERNKKLLSHLLNEEEFWGEYVIPNIARNDASFEEQDYWRGRIWAPTNFLVGEALLCAGNREVWEELAERGYRMFLREWKKKGVVGENYNAITGETAEKANSDKFYHWGALLVYMAIQTAVNFDEWEGKTAMSGRPEWMEPVRGIAYRDGRIDID